MQLHAANGTAWLSSPAMADLYHTTRENIIQIVGRILADGELDESTTNSEFVVRKEDARQVRREVKLFNRSAGRIDWVKDGSNDQESAVDRSSMAHVNGIDIYYEVQGQGEWFVLIGGLGVDSSVLRQYKTALARNYRVLVFDNRGAGRSSKPDIPYSIAMMAQDTVSLMDALGIKRANVLGVSLGGRIALELSLKNPQRVANLILVATSPSVQSKLSPIAKLTKRVRSLSRRQQPYYAFRRQLAASSGYDCTDQLCEITARTLIMYGASDRMATRAQAEDMQRRIANCEVMGFSGGHLFVFLHADDVITEILRFLA